jgi:trimeric autotransporter adhesin
MGSLSGKGVSMRLRHLLASVTLGAALLIPASPQAVAGSICTVPGNYPSIQQAVNDPGCALIRVAPGTYEEEIVVNRSVAIVRTGGRPVIVDPASGRPLTVTAGLVNVRRLVLQGGNVPGSHGGGVNVAGATTNLTLGDVIIRNNTAGFSAGAIFGEGGAALHVVDSTISGNRALDGNGGAFNFNGGSLTIWDSTITDNEAALDPGDADTGGVYTSATLEIRNSTISGNRAEGDGAGVKVFDSATLTHVTVTGNRADVDQNGTGDGGGIVRAASSTGSLSVQSSIIAGNQDLTPGSGDADECAGTITSLGRNVVRHDGGCNFIPGPDDRVGDLGGTGPVEARLRPLADNGGETRTHAIRNSSPARNLVPHGTPGCGGQDQRSAPRPGAGSRRCDAGSYEYTTCRGFVVNRIGSDWHDRLVGTSRADGFIGLAGNDVLRGRGGADRVCAGPGDDSLLGNDGDDLLDGGGGSDRCVGGPGTDRAISCERKRGIP